MNVHCRQLIPYLTLSIITLSLTQCSSLHYSNDYVNESISNRKIVLDDGCYAKSLIPDKLQISQDTFYELSNIKMIDASNSETIIVTTKPETTTWIKKKTDMNCVSSNPDDCLIWCLVESPAEEIELTIVIDTSLTPYFKRTILDIKVLEESGGFTEEKQILCKTQRTAEIITSLQKSLIYRGFPISNVTGTFNKETKAALVDFQQAYYLPIGQLDIETLDELDIIF